MAKIEENIINNSTPGDLKKKGVYLLITLVTNQAMIFADRIVPALEKQLIKFEGDCPTPEEIAKVISVRKGVLEQANSIAKILKGVTFTVDLAKLESTYLDETLIKDGKNEFAFVLPHTDNKVTFKILTHKDEREIEREVTGLKKLDKKISPESSTRLKFMITSVNGLTEQKDIREFVDNYLLAKDARELRKKYVEVAPDIKMIATVDTVDGGQEDIEVPVTLKFFWPDF